jgi:ferrochelatase
MSPAILLTCHGTVDRVEDLPAFLANIRRGRPTPPEVLAEVTRRFQHIGGSPLLRITGEQAAALEARLGVPVHVASRLWHPYPRDVVARLVEHGVRTIVSLPLAPQSVHVYHAAVREAVGEATGVRLVEVPSWGDEPLLVEAFAEAIDEAIARFPDGSRRGVAVVLSAHSLPRRVVAAGDPYERDFRAMAALVGERYAARGHEVRVAFQSQGQTEDAWMGPDLAETFTSLADEGARDVVIAPIGFVADHVETLYDIDVEAQVLARRAGLAWLERMPAMNARPRFIDALEAVARRALGS